jgi:biopolymer transport protein ExbD
MSHGPATEDKSAEPNLTPLLDVVLQLLMFFMMCVNFTQEQATQDVKLPSAEAAKPLDASETDVLYVNLRPYIRADFADRPPDVMERLQRDFKNEGDPMVMVIGKDPMRPIDARAWLKQMYADKLAEMKLKDPRNPAPQVKTMVILRASENLTCDQVYQIMDLCKVAGFRELRLRAKILNTPKPGG